MDNSGYFSLDGLVRVHEVSLLSVRVLPTLVTYRFRLLWEAERDKVLLVSEPGYPYNDNTIHQHILFIR